MDQPEALCTLEEMRDNIENVLSDLNYYIQQTKDELVRMACPKVGNHTLEFSHSHNCSTSPTDYCAFDIDVDPCCDDCLFCGQPEERK